MTKRCRLFASFVVVVGISVTVAAGVPDKISYQGQLNDQAGAPVNGTVSMTFSLYEVESGGSALWSETQSVQVSNGVFSVQLGAATPLVSSLFAGNVLYLGVRAGADQEMTPRLHLTTAAYSHRAEFVNDPVLPVGSVVAWSKSMPGTPALHPSWVECNGQVLSDPNSPYDGQTIPDLNGGVSTPRFLRGGNSSGAVGGTEEHTHSLNWYGYAGGSGSAQRYLNTQQNVSSTSTLPSYYTVVWIMKVK